MSNIYIGIDVGGTNIKIGCFDNKIHLLAKTNFSTQADMGPATVIKSMAEKVQTLIKSVDLTMTDVVGIGIGTPGPANYSAGIIISSTNMPKFKNVHIRDMLSKDLDKPVIFDNDANVACYGEFVCGAGKDVSDMVFFTLGTGIGGGIVSNGKLIRGSGGNAAELGHIIIVPDGRLCNCGQKGCAEAYASASWTAARAREAIEAGDKSSMANVLKENGQITCKDVYEHLMAGDELAKKITDETAKILGLLCINVLHFTEPKTIVFAGGMIAAGDILLEEIKKTFDEHIWKLKKETIDICFATLGEDAGIIGAAALAKDSFADKKSMTN